MSTKIHFLVQNLRHSGTRLPQKDDGNPKNRSLYERCRRFKVMVDRLDPDIILAQEAREGWIKAFEDWFSDRYDLVFRPRGPVGIPGGNDGVPILWKKDLYDCLDHGFFWLSETPELPTPSYDNPAEYGRIVTWVRLKEKATGLEFFCFSNHFGFGEQVRIRSQQQLNRVLDSLPKGTYAFIGGDYNAYYRTEKYNEFMDFSWDSVIDLRDMAMNMKDTVTFGGMKSGHNLAFGQGRPLPEVNDTHPQIDFLMAKPHPHMKVTHYGFDYTTYEDPADGVGPGNISDHWGLEVKVEINTEEDYAAHQHPHDYGEEPIYF